MSKENFLGDELSHLGQDFYIRVTAHIKKSPEKDRDKLETHLKTLIRKRLGKLVPRANSLELSNELAKKLTIEENELYNSIHKSGQNFIDKIFKGQTG